MLAEFCPKCQQKSNVQSTQHGIQWRICKTCDYRYKTCISLIDDSKDIKEILADYGHSINAKTLDQLRAESSMAEIQNYLTNQTRIISHYELEKNKRVDNPTGFIINAILNHYPIPASVFVNGNGYHHEAVTANIPPPPIIKNGAADTWAEILGRLEGRLAHGAVDSWLRGSKGVYQSDSMLVVQVVSREAMEWLEERLAKTIFEETDGLELRFII